MKEKEANSVRAIERAIRILNSFTSKESELSLGKISEYTGLPKSTVHRIISSLEQDYFIEQDETTGYYHLGFQLMRLGSIAAERIDLRKIALPIMKSLSNYTNQTSNLYELRGFNRLCIEQVPGPQYTRSYSYVGALFPLYCGSSGKVLLANLGEEKIEEYFKNVKFEKYTDKTIIDVDVLRSQLEKIREQGYSYSNSERDLGAASVSAPIFDYRNSLVGCVTVSGPEVMFTDADRKKYISFLLEAAAEISAHLGYMK